MKTQGSRIERGYPHISRTPGVVGGSPAIDGTRIRVADIVCQTMNAVEHGTDVVDYILRAYPHLSREQIDDARRFYADHQPEIDSYIANEEAILKD